jgi:SAM-dependent methyltransferase
MDAEARSSQNFDLRDEFGNAEANLRFLEGASLAAGARVLEIGTGRGALLRHLLGLGCIARGVERSTERIAESREIHGDLPVTRVTGITLPFADASFDVVLSFDVFEHIKDSNGHLNEVNRVLAPGGRYLLQTPNKWTNTIFETLRWRSFTSWRPDHCALHTYGQLRRRLERHGFDVRFHDVPVVTDFFRRKIAHYLGAPGLLALRFGNPDRLPMRFRTNFYVEATKRRASPPSAG